MKAIAIDGPAGAGKSTIAKLISKRLGYTYIDTGAMYRAVATYLYEHGIAKDDEASITKAMDDIDIDIEYIDGMQHVYLNGVDITHSLRDEHIGEIASASSVYAPVREKLVELQRLMATKQNVVMDGRDIGTVVLPSADTKIYLTADSRVRAIRRIKQLEEQAESHVSLEQIEADIIARDHRDMTRENSPLMQAEDATLVDTSDMSIEEVVEKILKIAG